MEDPARRPGVVRELRVAALTDRGQVRDGNEDAFHADLAAPERAATHGHLFLVADGMGGHEAGEVASAIARDEVRRDYYAAPPASDADMRETLRRALRAANWEINRERQRNPARHDMGTTCSVVLIRGGQFWVAHIGDSRVYRWRPGRLQRLTRDHNWAEELVEAGRIDTLEAMNHLGRHMLTRALGIETDLQADVHEARPLEPGDRLLLCTDGLTGDVSEEEIETLLGSGDPAHAARALVTAANRAGGLDNITVIVIEAV
jgi:protein phosphatase